MYNKKVVAVFVVVILCVCAVAVAIPMLNNNQQKDDGYIKITIDGDKSIYTCKYSDDYFFEKSTDYNKSLATASLVRDAITENNSTDPNENTKNIRHYLVDQAGFSNFELNEDYKNTPKEDTIGAFATYKTIGKDDHEYTLIAIGFRCSGYGVEWVNNFKVGYGDEYGNHEGFKESADKVLNFVKGYIEEQGISGDVKLWITGYSRGGAVANMMGGMMDTAIRNNGKVFDNVNVTKNDIFIYTFESPNTVAPIGFDAHSDAYGNIWNHFSCGDMVSWLPNCWGFTHYGNPVFFPTMNVGFDLSKDGWKDMIDVYESIDGNREDLKITPYNVVMKSYFGIEVPWIEEIDSKGRENDTLGEYMEGMMDMTGKYLSDDREGYVRDVQGIVMELMGILMVHDYSGAATFVKSLTQSMMSDLGKCLQMYLAIKNENYEEGLASFIDATDEYIKKALKDAELDVNRAGDLEKDLYLGCRVVYVAALEEIESGNDLVPIASVIGNYSQVFAQHADLRIHYSWLKSWDPLYN